MKTEIRRSIKITIFSALLFVILGTICALPTAIQAAERIKDVSFDDVKFEMEKGAPFKRELITSEIEDLKGKKIRIRGYILPTFKRDGLKQFVLVRDNKECCFGPGAALYDCIIVRMEKGKSASFKVRPVAVEGTFYIKEFKVAKETMAIYRMKATSVK